MSEEIKKLEIELAETREELRNAIRLYNDEIMSNEYKDWAKPEFREARKRWEEQLNQKLFNKDEIVSNEYKETRDAELAEAKYEAEWEGSGKGGNR